MKKLVIRPLGSMEDFNEAERLQQDVWVGDTPVMAAMLKIVAANGGVAIGAFDGGKMIGLVFGFLGADEELLEEPLPGRLKHCSHLLAVLPGYRDRQVGFQLKAAQRQAVLGQGLDRVTWTSDPLEARNARLNITRLGAVCDTYLRNAYGEMRDDLNRGLPSDRFQLDWWVASRRVELCLAAAAARSFDGKPSVEEALLLNPSVPGRADSLPRPTEDLAPLVGEALLVEIPPDFQAIKAQDLGLALAWRMQTRAAFEEAFSRGYLVTGFHRTVLEGRERAFYQLTWLLSSLEG